MHPQSPNKGQESLADVPPHPSEGGFWYNSILKRYVESGQLRLRGLRWSPLILTASHPMFKGPRLPGYQDIGEWWSISPIDILINRKARHVPMAKSITGTFTITQSITLSATGYTTTAIAIGSLIDVGDAQALEVESVDYVSSNYDSTNDRYEAMGVTHPWTGAASWGCQLLDRNSQEWLDPSDNNVISSFAGQFDSDGITSVGADFYPDDFQKTNGRFVVNDEMYLVSNISTGAFSAAQELNIAVRIRAKVVKLSTRDWMAISLETVQNE